MPISTLQNILNGGEISPTLSARIDQGRYQSGALCMENLVPIPQGGVTRRPGFYYAFTAKDQIPASNVRLFSFVYSSTQGRVLEFGHLYMRVYSPSAVLLFELATPYHSDHVLELSISQSADVLFIAHANYQPHKISRYADKDWRLELLSFSPNLPTPINPSLSIIGSSIAEYNSVYQYVVTAINSDGIESSQSVESAITAKPLSQVYYIRLNLAIVADAVEYRIYKRRGGVYGFIGRTGDLYFDDINIAPDTEDTPPRYKNPFAAVDEYPSLVFLHQQRLGFASSNKRPLTVWLTQSANLESMAASLPPKPDDAIEVTLAATQVNRILAIGQDRDNLVVLTEGSEWLLTGGGNDTVIKPANVGFQLQGKHGAEAFVSVLGTGSSMLFVQRGGNTVRDFSYTYQVDKYESMDISILAKNILKDLSIQSWAYQQEPHGLIWANTTDGKLVAITYLREHDIIGWHRHFIDGFIENVISLLGVPDDVLYAVVLRKKGDGTYIRTIEKMAYFFDSDDIESAYHVDAGKTIVAEATSITQIEGLDHLEGREVQIFTDGYVQNPQIVIGGKVVLEYPALRIAHVGLGYISKLIPTVAEIIADQGNSVFHIRKVSAASLKLYNSMSFKISLYGQEAQDISLHQIKNNSVQINPTHFTLSDVTLHLAGGFDLPMSPTFIMDDPTPCTILAFTLVVDISPMIGV